MITQDYKYSDYTGSNVYFIIGTSWEEVFKELEEFANTHKTDTNSVWFYKNPIVPSKINLRPEYSLEVLIVENNEWHALLFYQQYC